MARRLFHAIVLVGTALGTACSSETSEPPVSTDSGSVADSKTSDATTDTFPTIAFDSGGLDSTVADSGTADVAKDTASSDTFPGIMPMMTDSFPGIMPPPPPDGFPPIA
jgi:hypothetical protein